MLLDFFSYPHSSANRRAREEAAAIDAALDAMHASNERRLDASAADADISRAESFLSDCRDLGIIQMHRQRRAQARESRRILSRYREDVQ